MKFFIGKKEDFKEKEGKEVVIDGRPIAVFKVKGRFFSFKNICPHKGWKLHEGAVNENTLSVKCPGHSWEFNIATGEYVGNSNIKIRTYNIIEEEDNLYIEI